MPGSNGRSQRPDIDNDPQSPIRKLPIQSGEPLPSRVESNMENVPVPQDIYSDGEEGGDGNNEKDYSKWNAIGSLLGGVMNSIPNTYGLYNPDNSASVNDAVYGNSTEDPTVRLLMSASGKDPSMRNAVNEISGSAVDYSNVRNNQNLYNTWNSGAINNGVDYKFGMANVTDNLIASGKGAAAGSAFGPWGMLIGGIAGGVANIGSQIGGANRAAFLNKVSETANKKTLNSFYDTAARNDQRQFRTNMRNYFAEGGVIPESNGITSFNVGGSHEQNPYGGIQQGIAPDGQPNYVEEGEVRYEDYIFSDRIKATKAILKKYKLPVKYAKKSFADIANKLSEYSKDRPNDNIAKNTLDENMSRLEDAQEEVKREQEAEQFIKAFQRMSPNEQIQLLQGLQGQQPDQQLVQNADDQVMQNPYGMQAQDQASYDQQMQQALMAQQMQGQGFARGGHLFAGGGNNYMEVPHTVADEPATTSSAYIFPAQITTWDELLQAVDNIKTAADLNTVLNAVTKDAFYRNKKFGYLNRAALDDKKLKEYVEKNDASQLLLDIMHDYTVTRIYNTNTGEREWRQNSIRYYDPYSKYYMSGKDIADNWDYMKEYEKILLRMQLSPEYFDEKGDLRKDVISKVKGNKKQPLELNDAYKKVVQDKNLNLYGEGVFGYAHKPNADVLSELLKDKVEFYKGDEQFTPEGFNPDGLDLGNLDPEKYNPEADDWWFDKKGTVTGPNGENIYQYRYSPVTRGNRYFKKVLKDDGNFVWEKMDSPDITKESVIPGFTFDPSLTKVRDIDNDHTIYTDYYWVPEGSKKPVEVEPIKDDWRRKAPEIGALAGLAMASMPPDLTYADELRRLAGYYNPIAPTLLGGYRRYTPYDINLKNNEDIAQDAAMLRANLDTANRASQIANALAIQNSSERRAANRNLEWQEKNETNRKDVDAYNLDIDKTNVSTKQFYDNLNRDIFNRRMALYENAAKQEDAATTTRSENISKALTNYFTMLGQMGKEAVNMEMVNRAISDGVFPWGTPTYFEPYYTTRTRDKKTDEKR